MGLTPASTSLKVAKIALAAPTRRHPGAAPCGALAESKATVAPMDKETPASPDSSGQTTPRLAFLVLALCFVLMALARGASETFTVFLLPISNAFGWDRAQTVSVYSI